MVELVQHIDGHNGMKRLLLASSALLLVSPAIAQTWSGTGQRTVSYPGGALGSYPGVIGDGTTAQGGTPPAYGHEPADIGAAAAGYTLSQWQPTTGTVRVTGSSEHKVRFECNSSHAAQEDPILFHGQAKKGHEHEFVGNSLAGKDSTYASLRMAGKGSCPGGPVNRTAYWHPAMMKTLPSGVAALIRSDREIFYYSHAATRSARKTRIPNGFAFIGGSDPADPSNAARLAEVPAGFVISSFYGPNRNGLTGWTCLLSNGSLVTNANGGTTGYPALQTPGGTDPWLGNCPAGASLYVEVIAPMCWDGHNLTSPDGRGHVRYPVRHSNSGIDELCPTGWWQVPTFIAKTFYSVGTGGWSDYSQWYLSSDRHGLTQANWRRPGTTFHFDWMNGWDPVSLDDWQVECTGVTIGARTGNGAGCDSATIGINKRLWSNGEASPDTSLSNNPVVNLNIKHWDDGVGRFYPLLPGTPVPGTVDHTH